MKIRTFDSSDVIEQFTLYMDSRPPQPELSLLKSGSGLGKRDKRKF